MVGSPPKVINLKNLICIFISAILVISSPMHIFASSPVIVTGEGYTDKNNSTGLYSGQVNGSLSNPSSDIDVKVRTSGGTEIVYSLDISWGSMVFEYDYGFFWNPTTHSYETSGRYRQNGGWIEDNYVDDVNNAITITNNSNFPMSSHLTYSHSAGGTSAQFNANPNTDGSVVGIFSTEPGELSNEAILSEGKGGAHAVSSVDVTLEMDTSNITSGQYYYKSGSAAPTPGSNEKTVYFALSGKPDPGFSRDFTKVGDITVQIAPVSGATRVDIP